MAHSDDPRALEFEQTPLTRSEYVQTMVHFYRGEVSRSNAWRQRLDTTTNWAVVTTAAIMTFVFSEPGRTHLLLLLVNFPVMGFLLMEARRFRFFAVYRARVRMLEENFLLPIVTRDLTSPHPGWREIVAMDLDVPKFKNTLIEAVAMRIRNNYFWVFSWIFGAWLLKSWIHPVPANTLAEWYAHMAVPPLPGWSVLVPGSAFFGWVLYIFLQARRLPAVVEDEIHGVETERHLWKY